MSTSAAPGSDSSVDTQGTWITLPDYRASKGSQPYPSDYPRLPEGVPATHPVYRLLGALEGFAGRTSSGKSEGRFLCPVHVDTNPSLDVRLGGDSQPVVMKCWGCDATGIAVCNALGHEVSVLFDSLGFDPDEVDWKSNFGGGGGGGGGGSGDRRAKKWLVPPTVVATYDYSLEDGSPYLRMHRKEGVLEDGATGKDFSGGAEHWDVESGWLPGEAGLPYVPYNLSQFAEWKAEGMVLHVVEGEKDADTLVSRGFAATTFPHGASLLTGEEARRKKQKPSRLAPEVWSYFEGFTMIDVIADRDIRGVEHARLLKRALGSVLKPMNGLVTALVTPSRFGPKSDVSDLLDAGGKLSDLVKLTATRAEQIRQEDLAVDRTSSTSSEGRVDVISGRRLVATSLDRIVPKKVDWLWDGLIPLGEFTLLAGRQGIGKSTLAYQIAADVTTGKLAGALKGQARDVLVIATEDSVEHTIVPRLLAAGADMTRVKTVVAKRSDGFNGPIDFTQDLPELSALIREHDVALVIIDPLMSRLGGKVDTHKDADVRTVLEPLVALAQTRKVGLLGLIHLNKGQSTDPLNLIMGSVAFTAVVRSVLYLGIDPESPEVRVLGQVKSNLGPMSEGTLTFTLVPKVLQFAGSAPVTTSQLAWGQNDDRSIPDIIAVERRSSRGPTIQEQCAAWIAAYLRQNGGAAQRPDVLAAAAEEGWNTNQINTGFRALKARGQIESGRANEQGGTATWRLTGFNLAGDEASHAY